MHGGTFCRILNHAGESLHAPCCTVMILLWRAESFSDFWAGEVLLHVAMCCWTLQHLTGAILQEASHRGTELLLLKTSAEECACCAVQVVYYVNAIDTVTVL